MNEPTGPWPTYKRLLGYAQPYRPLLVMAMVGMAIEAAAGGGFTMLMKPIIDETFDPKVTTLSWHLPLFIVGLFIARGLAGFITDYCMARAGRSVSRDLRNLLLGKYLRLPGLRFDAETVPSMLTRLGGDTEQVAQAAVDAMKVMVSQGLQVIVMFAVMMMASPRVTLAILLLGPVLAFLMDRVGRRYRSINHRIQEGAAKMLQSAEQALKGQQEVKIYGAQQAELERYAALVQRNLQLSLKVETTRSSASVLVQLMGAIGLAALLLVAGHEAAQGRMTAGDFVKMMVAMMAIIPALRQLTNVQSMLQRGVSSANRLFSVLDLQDEADTGERKLDRARGVLEFRNVSARYEGQQEPALSGISFTARPGTVTAIVGRSGSGKTTLIKLIPRFYPPESGQILLDGYPVEEYPLADLRRQIALVSQSVMLFDDSVAANVAYGELAAAGEDELAAAIRGANAMEFVERMPEGAASAIGENGGRLSGGQRQRLAIARAMLKDAPILILDEATAALDNESERLVQDALQQLMPDRTTLVIAHRLSTIEHADQVLVLDQGRLVEQGTHSELIARGGLYARLHRMQFREPVDAMGQDTA
ncbi:ATP-binding cassette, subfamily B, MsbA [Luteimonas cucumeris]|uniref:ATP-binding cassette, subfamily B, MsbA n=1 Tax=Luteimonas cucumeris TaxID=985012 RepID=A0A562LAA5_9GAMM|nr:lipid A export permease/ATP-binding protein MsbA [Luteimonas cucumeris]TWI04495.1 ATP-binding cassette, subfamily B, MsbA [Luteimonas cucumeris]